MSKHNYSQYSNKNVNKATIDTNDTVETTITVPVETLEYTGEVELAESTPVETIKYKEDKTDTVFGKVTNCVKLNVRVAPNPNATVACVLDANSELEIDYNKSTAEWYSVCTAAGIKGYCMRKFITPRK